MQASSTVSPREEGQPRQCIPMAKNRGADWGATSRMSPMMVSFSIFTAIIMTSLFLSAIIITAHAEKNKREVAKDTQPPRRFFVARLPMIRASVLAHPDNTRKIHFFPHRIGRAALHPLCHAVFLFSPDVPCGKTHLLQWMLSVESARRQCGIPPFHSTGSPADSMF